MCKEKYQVAQPSTTCSEQEDKCIMFKMISRNKDKCYLSREPTWLKGAEGCFHLLPQVKKDREREREMYTMIPPLELTLRYNKSVLTEQKMGFISMAFPKNYFPCLFCY